MPKVNRADLFAYEFLLPSIDKQTVAVEKLDEAIAAARSIRIEGRSRSRDAESVTGAVLRAAFAGTLIV